MSTAHIYGDPPTAVCDETSATGHGLAPEVGKAWMARIGARFLLRTDPDLALYGRYCVSSRLKVARFPFAFPEIGPALLDVFRKAGN